MTLDFTTGFLIGYLVGALSICITVPMLFRWAITKLMKRAANDPIGFVMEMTKGLKTKKVPIDEPQKDDYIRKD